jgi:hypothetical protein
MLLYLYDDIVLYLLDFLNLTDYYSLKATNKHLNDIIPNDKRNCLLKQWNKISKALKVCSKYETNWVLSQSDFYSKTYFVQDFGLLIKCFYQNQINDECNFHNLYIFVVTCDNTCYLLFYEPLLHNVIKSLFCFHYHDKHLTIHNATKKFEILLHANGRFETKRGDYDGKCVKIDQNWEEYEKLKVNVSNNTLMIYEKTDYSFYAFKTLFLCAEKRSIFTKIGHYLILKILESQRYAVFDFCTTETYPLDFELDETLSEKCLHFIYLSKTNMIALIIFNKCTVFQRVENKWVVYRKFQHKLFSTYYGFCEDEQRMIKFF